MSPKLPVITPRKLIQALERSGFIIHRQRGSHIYLYHPDTPANLVTVPMHNKDLKKGTLRGILRQAGMDAEDLIELL